MRSSGPSPLLIALKAGFCLGAAVLAAQILGWGFDAESSRLYISQMKEQGYKGVVLVGLLIFLVGLSAIIFLLCGRFLASSVRLVLALCLGGIATTSAYSPIHLAIFILLVGSYGLVAFHYLLTTFALRSEAWGFVLLAGCALCLLAMFGLGPSGQKMMALLFLGFETAQVQICIPLSTIAVRRRHLKTCVDKPKRSAILAGRRLSSTLGLIPCLTRPPPSCSCKH